jgi:sugar/nucleoside kinase (ribokinase family)
MFDVIAIGSATRDAFFEANFPTVNWPKTPSRKAYLLPKGEKLEVENVFFTIGGNAVNASVTFARQGFKTAAVGKTGCDVSGEEIRRRLQKERVDTALMSYVSDLPTAYSVLLLEKGERTILAYHGASDSFGLGDLRPAKMRAKWWYASLAGESHKMFKKLLAFAVHSGTAVAFNPSGYHIKHGRNEILSSLKNLSFLVLNDEEAAMLTGIPWQKEKEVFKKLDKLTPGILAVTSGRNGVTVSDGRYIYKAGIFKEKKLADRTGAGDAFGSGFTAGLMRRGVSRANAGKARPSDVCYAICLATANATAVIEKVGATEGVLTKKEFANPRWRNLKISMAKI